MGWVAEEEAAGLHGLHISADSLQAFCLLGYLKKGARHDTAENKPRGSIDFNPVFIYYNILKNEMKNYFVPVNLLILASAVFFITQIVTFRIAREIDPPFSRGYSKGTLVSGIKETKPLELYKTILSRNIFNSKTLAALLAPPVRSSDAMKDAKQLVPIRLIGTVAGDARFAFALIEDPFQKSHKIFRTNDTIAPGVALLG